MLESLLHKVIGTPSEREIKKVRPLVARINALEPTYKNASDDELKAMTPEFRRRLDGGATLEELLPDAFAVVREAGRRVLAMRHFDVQLIGGVILHRGHIAEMKTGEGKTLVATLPAYLNALSGKGVHVVTVNGYLATRDAEWMGRIYRWLGLQTGVIVHGLSNPERRKSYEADITYGTNSEYGFDYLRDNMKLAVEHMVQRGHNYCIVDEVDSILIDEARTPLIISGAAEASVERYYEIDKVVPGMQQEIDYLLDEESRQVTLTDAGIDKIEKRLGLDNLYAPDHIETLHHVQQALRAHTLYKRDRDYAIMNGEVVIIDTFTGRLMPGRRWSDGLHQAIEAKENMTIEKENETLATITYQKYYQKYAKLSGMTGTALTEAVEFEKIYKVKTSAIPTNRAVARLDHDDVVYLTEGEKFQAAVDEIAEVREQGRPVLVGTASVEKSELLHRMLTARQIPHQVLNAKHHGTEAMVIAQAGRPGSVTISTNMAGRGTDILLGGNAEYLAKDEVGPWDPSQEVQEDYDRRLREATAKHVGECERDRKAVLDAGGLHVVGTERHESRRIDNQLRGRSGRQGDLGSSRFFLSLEDDLLRIFGTDRLKGMMKNMGMQEGEPLEHPWLSKAVENAQKKVEARNFGIRKNLLEYDEVNSQQRDVVYGIRTRIIRGENTRGLVMDLVHDLIANFAEARFPPKAGIEDLDLNGFNADVAGLFPGIDGLALTLSDVHSVPHEQVIEKLTNVIDAWYRGKEELIGPDNARYRERFFLLRVIDDLWKKHLQAMDYLRSGIGLQGYAQRNPLLEYKKQGFEYFQAMLDMRDREAIEALFGNLAKERALTEEEKAVLLQEQREAEEAAAAAAVARANQLGGGSAADRPSRPAARGATPARAVIQVVRTEAEKVGRNDPCPCGSGKKYKKCHMMEDQQRDAQPA